MKLAPWLVAAALAATLGPCLSACTSIEPTGGRATSTSRSGESRANAARNSDLTFSEPKFKSLEQGTLVGETETGVIDVTNNSDTDVDIGSMNVLRAKGGTADAASDFSVVGDSCQGLIPAHGSCTITVDYTPTEVGTASAVLQLWLPDSNSVLDIPVTRTGMITTPVQSTPRATDSTDTTEAPTGDPTTSPSPED
ncbi:hypothetical protein GY21_13495 [Cryobacterium roopkundense]|uniref:Abnormal spindle-like microcephaly-associated protein ASH domain-containing protein n=1 Tax=Cryobacterium roopkundense TaxID=1001240 RepID=A0A099J5E1_9MICO|nr:hypothetical protein [Cryobacterium roopkundense]KGJ72717.1 hypothetical protein GY21_13495 [Cryobacterium roopkundense]MBB5641798.1 hypothetical protein [Cryobacterium roopkundense]